MARGDRYIPLIATPGRAMAGEVMNSSPRQEVAPITENRQCLEPAKMKGILNVWHEAERPNDNATHSNRKHSSNGQLSGDR